jgi:hypothetical protein
MSQSAQALTIAIFLSVVYLGLAIAARRHMKEEHRRAEVHRLLAFTFWWPFYDAYDRGAKGLRLTGRLVLVGAVAAYVAWVKL